MQSAKRKLYDAAVARGLWKESAAGNSRLDYWTAGVLAYFDAAGADAARMVSHPITTREALHKYDPELFAFVSETMAYEGKVDWRMGDN